ncbi:MAG: tRNA (N(6)-L-threonylcarbamoyladenosine(37)-C(2))-methylthiotransferase MtaB [Kiritimatiellae bacterium]|nr:tRNA (N(6)-L-threonylcarbamoyladenosine(37)-C(2))-methylthiotransferase MtaB [Kiritimatiellia bacterium]
MDTEQNQATVSFKTVGCRLNQAETAIIAGQFKEAGYKVVPFGTPSDVSVIHSCTITANAERKSLQFARSARKQFSAHTVVIAGCAVERGNIDAIKKAGADIVVGQKDKYRLLDLLSSSDREKNTNIYSISTPSIPPLFQTTRALIKIQDGCNFNCAYCIVPSTRGRPTNRALPEILDEVKAVIRNGFKEIVLTGANLGCYKDGSKDLVDLVHALEALPHLHRIRLSSIELTTVETRIVDHMAQSEKLCQYLHIPLQSGSNKILKSMGRRYNAQQYTDLIMYAANKIPHIGIGTDLIVGYPGEQDEHFEDTFNLIEQLPFSNLHVFPYSIRPGTTAATMPGHINNTTKKSRASRLIALGERKKTEFAASFIGKSVSMLVEDVSEDHTAKGWTSEYIQAKFKSLHIQKNDIAQFTPSAIEKNTLTGSN